MSKPGFQITDAPLEPEFLRESLSDIRGGGFVAFEGRVRNHDGGRPVTSLEYEAYPTLCLTEGEKILQEARERFEILDAACTHRTGHLGLGEVAVWVGVNAAHRQAAFEACRYIIDEVKHRLPIWKKEHYADGPSEWVNCQGCGHAHHHYTETFSDGEMAFYQRQMQLPTVGLRGQQLLKQAKVLVVGAGALGCAALPYLASAGVGTIGICDGDAADSSNLHRQVLYQAADVGRNKAHLAAQRLRGQNPYIHILPHPDYLSDENGESLVSAYDIILDCTDNFRTKFLVNDLAVRLGKTLIQAAIYQEEGQLWLYHPQDTDPPCLRCLWPEEPADGCVGTCGDVGILGVAAAQLGILQATEALKLILQLPKEQRLQSDTLLLVEPLRYETRRIRRKLRLDCEFCGYRPSSETDAPAPQEHQPSLELDWSEVSRNLHQYRVVDIREFNEEPQFPPYLDAGEIVRMPLSSLGNSLDFPASLGENQTTLPTLLVCQRGRRSLLLAEQMQARGAEQVFSLKGGVQSMLRDLALRNEAPLRP